MAKKQETVSDLKFEVFHIISRLSEYISVFLISGNPDEIYQEIERFKEKSHRVSIKIKELKDGEKLSDAELKEVAIAEEFHNIAGHMISVIEALKNK